MASRTAGSLPRAREAVLLSNGHYSVLLSDRAGGCSRWRDLALTRWRDDPTRDACGSHIFLRDVDTGMIHRMGPCTPAAEQAGASFLAGLACFDREWDGLRARLEVAVPSGHDVEMRALTLTNTGTAPRTFEWTSYAELVLGPAAADAAHPAFSKMFVETARGSGDLLLATRRPGTPDAPRLYAGHWCTIGAGVHAREEAAAAGFETDRARFLGRCRRLRDAQALQSGQVLSRTVGTVLDPVFSLRRRVRLEGGGHIRAAFWTAAAATREAVEQMAADLHDDAAVERVLAAVRSTDSPVDGDSDSTDAEPAWRRQLLAAVMHADPAWRAPPSELARGRGGAPVLWAASISGDRPILLLRVAAAASMEGVPPFLHAQRDWQAAWLGIDVVILVEACASAAMAQLQAMADAQHAALAASDAAKAEIFLVHADHISAELRAGLYSAARVFQDGPLQMRNVLVGGGDAEPRASVQPACAPAIPRRSLPEQAAAPSAKLAFDNGYGGFDPVAREYQVRLDGMRCTPMPWINVIANEQFGFLVSSEGGGYSWAVNSQQNPLTPWANDPVQDTPHDVLYLRDEDDGALWTACAAPIRLAGAKYLVRHGKGYSRFHCDAHGIASELLQFVPLDDPVKISCLRLHNAGDRPRRLSVTAYVEWALAPIGVDGRQHVVTALDAATGAIFARNPWRAPFTDRVAFLDLGAAQQAATADRGEFIGPDGDIDGPAALVAGTPLAGRFGAGLDPCGALQAPIELAPGATVAVVVVLGEAASSEAAGALVLKYRSADLAAVFQEVFTGWQGMLDTVQVRTPDAAMDLMLNDWLRYQVLSCRVWARTACYQSSGAFGFRDQLQDVMALCLSRPDVARTHLLRAASRQFVEGDVQHWWLPPDGRGIRTRMSDDRLWLAWAALHYMDATGDLALFDEDIAFLAGPPLADGQLDAFFAPQVSDQSASVYEHCARAVDASLALGPHDLPLIGTGDWNDGMNRVGVDGRGESVWLAWFLLAVIDRLSPWTERRQDAERLARWHACRGRILAALATSAWDGSWFRRGYYDDGTPLGSAASEECHIDQIAQSWSVLSGVADPARARQAMRAVGDLLVWRNARISPLLTPPFDTGPCDPGYIKGYPPGLRENGGQYTHGATWSIFAYAALGEGARAAELFAFLNPVTHAASAAAIERYQVEPYVACGDVYSVAPHIGRGGWSWYTGSAGWLYRAGIEAILGLRVHGDTLEIDPAIPAHWSGFEITWHRRGAHGGISPCVIAVENPRHVSCGVASAVLDDEPVDPAHLAARGLRLPLPQDARQHRVRVVLG